MKEPIPADGGKIRSTKDAITCQSHFLGGWNRKKAEYILDRIFGYNKRMLWCEPPYSEEGKQAGVFHYRLFCDVNWNPIMPRGEVYSTKFTELGWKSFSELHGK
jgi:hypothetical protein